MKNYIDEGGVENIACALIEQARKDFVRGGKILYGLLKRIPTQKEFMADKKAVSLFNNADVRWMYDAWRFVTEDPYQFFGGAGEEAVIKAWINESIKEYYKVLYLRGATILYMKHANKKVHKVSDEEVLKLMDDEATAIEFIAARNYISNLKEAEDLFHEWNVISLSRARKRFTGKILMNKNEYINEKSNKRAKNIKTAKELYESGLSDKAIAKYLGVQVQTVRLYLKS